MFTFKSIKRCQLADQFFWIGPVDVLVSSLYGSLESELPKDASYIKLEYNPIQKISIVHLKNADRLVISWPKYRFQKIYCKRYCADSSVIEETITAYLSKKIYWEEYYPSDGFLVKMIVNTLLHKNPQFTSEWFDEWILENVKDKIASKCIYKMFEHDLFMMRLDNQ